MRAATKATTKRDQFFIDALRECLGFGPLYRGESGKTDEERFAGVTYGLGREHARATSAAPSGY